ncbi:hypothetical protein FOCC_FOCC012683 [Frankliniella occidentalis]|nr:hypothetical protein FOCC_FOCC012683 [Frankliniella occidentalis]
MDGSHVPIIAPIEDKAAFRNYHHQYSIKVQAVVDHKLLVTDIYIGEAGSLHDIRVFRRRPLCRNILSRNDMFGPEEHIITDSGYFIMEKVLIPFPRNGHLTAQQRNYNRRLSRVRARVEHTFARMDFLWRRNFYLPCTDMNYAVDHIAATVVLHNFNIIHSEEIHMGEGPQDDESDDDNGDYDVEDDNDRQFVQGLHDIIPDPHVPQGNPARELNLTHIRGEQKRWDMCNFLAR